MLGAQANVGEPAGGTDPIYIHFVIGRLRGGSATSRSEGTMSILFLTPMLPSSRHSGGEVVSQAIVDALRLANHQVEVVGYHRNGSEPRLHRDDHDAGGRSIETRSSGIHPFVWMAHALVTGQPYSVAKYMSRAYLQAARDAFVHRPAGIVVDHAASFWAFARLDHTGPYVYVAHNVSHRLHTGKGTVLRPIYLREARLLRSIEERLCTGATRVWTLTEDDAQTLRELGAGDRAVNLGPPSAPAAETKVSTEADIRVLGTWTWAPNAEGLRWFLSQVVPRLSADTTVEVGGLGAEDLCRGHSCVTCAGRVGDASLFLSGARVVAVPSVAGEGVQVKTLDAIATGLPVVATSIGLRGISDPPKSVTRADAPQEFANALMKAISRGSDSERRVEAVRWSHARQRRFELLVAQEALQLEALTRGA